MASAELTGSHIAVTVPLREKPLIQQTSARWHDATQTWRLAPTWAACKQLRGVFGDLLDVGPQLAAWSWQEYDGRVYPAQWLHSSAMLPGSPDIPELVTLYEAIDCAAPPEYALYEHQRPATAFMIMAGSAVLADDMGVGKSPTAAATLATLCNALPALIVCPKSMQRTWQRELLRWAVDVEPVLHEGTAPKRKKQVESLPDNGVLISTYDLIRRDSRLAGYGSMALTAAEKTDKELNLRGFRTVIADEAHRAGNRKAKQTRALWALGDKAEHRFALTGTPGDLSALWTLLRFVSPDEWPSHTKFIERYCNVNRNLWGGIETLSLKPETEAEFREIMEPRFLRRPKSLVLPYLPSKVYVTRDVVMSPKQAKAYRQMADGMVADVEGGRLTVFDPLVQGTRLANLASACAEVSDGAEGQEVRLCEPSSKLDVLEEVLDELGDSPCAVFSISRQLLDLAAARFEKAGRPYAAVLGGQHATVQDSNVQAYNSGQVNVLLVSLGAAAEGVSLTRGSHEIFLTRGSLRQNQQGEDRMHGTGRGDTDADHLTIIDLVTVDTVEEFRAQRRAIEAEEIDAIYRDQDSILAALTYGKKGKK